MAEEEARVEREGESLRNSWHLCLGMAFTSIITIVLLRLLAVVFLAFSFFFFFLDIFERTCKL
jgi:hypothetical protein